MIKILITAIVVAIVTAFTVTTVQKETANLETEVPLALDSDLAEDTKKEISIPAIVSSEVINLSGQGLTKTPSYVFDKTSVQELDLSNNKLDGALQAEVRHLQNLKMLNLSDNNFTGIPAEIGQLTNLEVLNLSGNPITGMPYELGNLKNLKVLDLRDTDYSKQDLEVIKKGLPANTKIYE